MIILLIGVSQHSIKLDRPHTLKKIEKKETKEINDTINSTYMNNASSLSGSSLFSPHRNTDKQIIIKFVSLTILMGIALNLFLNVNGFNPAMILFKTDFPIPYLTFNSIPYAPS